MIAIECDGQLIHAIDDTLNNRELLQELCNTQLRKFRVDSCEVVEINEE